MYIQLKSLLINVNSSYNLIISIINTCRCESLWTNFQICEIFVSRLIRDFFSFFLEDVMEVFLESYILECRWSHVWRMKIYILARWVFFFLFFLFLFLFLLIVCILAWKKTAFKKYCVFQDAPYEYLFLMFSSFFN